MDARTRDADRPETAQQEAQREPPPFWEWVVAGIGLVLLLASIGLLGWEAVRRPHVPPRPVVESIQVEPQGTQFLVRFQVRNTGTLTAERLKIGGRLLRQGEEVEDREAEFEFLPGGAMREGGLYFSRDPRQFELKVEPRSYQRP